MGRECTRWIWYSDNTKVRAAARNDIKVTVILGAQENHLPYGSRSVLGEGGGEGGGGCSPAWCPGCPHTSTPPRTPWLLGYVWTLCRNAFLSLCWQWRQRRRKSYLSPTDGSCARKGKVHSASWRTRRRMHRTTPRCRLRTRCAHPTTHSASHFRASRCLPALLNSQFGRFAPQLGIVPPPRLRHSLRYLWRYGLDSERRGTVQLCEGGPCTQQAVCLAGGC